MSDVRFTCTRVNASGRIGTLKPDADGYYVVCVGQVNAKNVSGVKYADTQHFRSLFERSSTFMRMVQAGNLYGELGHPKQQPGESDDKFMIRASSVEERNWCVFFKEIWLDDNIAKANPSIFEPGAVAIMAKMKPVGAYAHVAQAIVDDPDRNLNFSIRCIADQRYEQGRRVRYIDEIITFDLVTDPGMTSASKPSSPALESAGFDITVTRELLNRLTVECASGIHTESSARLVQTLERKLAAPASRKPVFANW